MWTSVSRFIGAKNDASAGDNCSCETCKAAVKSSPPTNKHPVFYRPDALPVTQPTVSKHWKQKYLIPWTCPKLTWGLPTLSLTTNSSWLPWGRVAKPLISPLMPVPRCVNWSLVINSSIRCYKQWLNFDNLQLEKNTARVEIENVHFLPAWFAHFGIGAGRIQIQCQCCFSSFGRFYHRPR